MPFARNVSLGVIPAILISVFLCTASNADAQVPVGANAYYTPNPVNSFTMTLYGFPGHVPTGTVSLQVEGASIGPVPLVNSTATLQPGINFAIGSHTAVLTYSGDDYYAPVSTPVSFDVPLPSLPMGQQATFAAGTPVPVNVYMYDQSGTVQGTISVSEGGTPLGSAPFNNAQQGALIVVNNLSPGVHTLTIHFAGNVSIPDGSFIITIEPTAVLTFGGGPLTGVVGSQIKIAVRLTDQLGVAVGLVVLVENGTVLDSTGIAAGGSAILNYPATTAGTHSLLVQFSGNRPAGDLPLSILVTKPGLSIVTGNVTGTYGTPVSFSILMGDSSATGTVALTEGTTKLATAQVQNGVAPVTIGGLNAGTHAVLAHFSGSVPVDDLNFSIVVARATTTTHVTATPVAGTNLVVAIGVSVASGATGTVQLAEGASVFATQPLDLSGSATFSVSTLSQGAHTLTATYSGDTNYIGSTSAQIAIQAGPLPTVTKIVSVSPNPAQFGQAVDVQVSVTAGAGIPSGSLVVTDAANSLGSITLGANGTVTLHLTVLTVGTHSLTANFLGAPGFVASSSGAVSVQVTAPSLAVANSASGSTAVSPGSLASIFGVALATSNAAATLPLPTNLGGVKLTLVDSAAASFAAPLVFVSPAQVNFLIPDAAATGPATLTLQGASGTLSASITLVAQAPGIFSADGSGMGAPAAFVVLAHADGSQTTTPVFQCSTSCGTVAIDLGSPADVAVLTLYGTGVGKDSLAKVSIGSLVLTPDYAGPQGEYPGLDQVNVRMPETLAGSGKQTVSVVIAGSVSNLLQLEFK